MGTGLGAGGASSFLTSALGGGGGGAGKGEAQDYKIKNPEKLRKLAEYVGVKTDGVSTEKIAEH